jgi:hypothetical protein
MEEIIAGFKYSVDEKLPYIKGKFTIVDPDRPTAPNFLYKYYAVTDYNIDAILNHYFYASHPNEFNDLFDSFMNLIDYKDLDLSEYIDILCDKTKIMSEEEIRHHYRENKDFLAREFSKIIHGLFYFQIGIISLTTQPVNMSMWNYYSKYDGFTVGYDTSNLDDKFWGPFPINYQEELTRIPFKGNFKTLSFLYQSNAKSIKWETEDEWRYLTFSKKPLKTKGYDIPNGAKREFSYHPNAIKEVTLGYRFFKRAEMTETPDARIVLIKLNNKKGQLKERRKLLKFLVRNPQIEIYYIIPSLISYAIDKKKVKIDYISTNRYRIIQI